MTWGPALSTDNPFEPKGGALEKLRELGAAARGEAPSPPAPAEDAQGSWYSEEYDAAWEGLEAASKAREAALRRVLRAVKENHRIPARDVDFELRASRQAMTEIRQSKLRKIDRDEFETLMARRVAVLELLRDQARSYRRPTAAQIHELLDSGAEPVQIGDRVARYESQTMLALVSKPEGNEYWQLLRAVANGVKHDRSTPSGIRNRRLERVQNALNFLAPAWLLYDNRKAIPSSAKWAWRTTKVNGIYNGGLPGLGQRA